MSKQTAELREKSTDELRRDIAEMERQVWELRFQRNSEKAGDPSKIRRLRKDVARRLTLIRERELGLERGGNK